jgi:gliding motility-associated protein GldM
MINLMYLVFIAMLALNIPAEVLDGFVLVNEKLQQTIQHSITRNNQMYQEMNLSYERNQEKTKDSYNKAQEVKQKTDSLFNYIQELKEEIARKTDGKNADVNNLDKKDNLDAAPEVMLSPIGGHGGKLKAAIDNYKGDITTYIQSPEKVELVKGLLSTEPSDRAKKENKSWAEASFGQMPTIAAVTYLTEIQSNVKQAESEALSSLIKNIDLSDFRVNELSAFVVPESKIVMRGTNYKADIILAAVDTTQRPRIVVNDKEITNGLLNLPTGSLGVHPLKGFIELMGHDGTARKIDFSEQYTVIEPMATVAPLLMDVLYSGINNEISISVPGVATQDVSASATGGTLTRSGNNWVARPTGNIGTKFTIAVSARVNGVQRTVANKEFRIRALPDPTAYIDYTDSKGAPKVFKQGSIARSVLLSAGGIKASIDDGILNVPFQVISFRTLTVDAMGNAMPEVSNGANFSERQQEQIRRQERGRYFFITGIRVKGPDGRERDIAPMEIRLN